MTNPPIYQFGSAGPVLDERVATGPMGWTLSDNGHFYGIAGHMQGPDKMLRYTHLWRPSTNIADAWEVLEHIAGWPNNWFNIHCDADSMHEDGNYLVQFPGMDTFFGLGGTSIEARAKTPQLAICWAALLYQRACEAARAKNASP